MQEPIETLKYTIGAWAMPFLVNGDTSGLSDGEITGIEIWHDLVTDDWRDSDDNLWVFFSESVDSDSRQFGRDEITGMMDNVYTLEIVFRKGN